MNQIDHSIDDIIAAYQARTLTREQVAQWLAQRKAAAPGKPCAIALSDPGIATAGHNPPLEKPTLVLAPLPAESTPEWEQSWEIDVIDHGGGVYALELRGQVQAWSTALAEQLRQAMQLVAARADAHALLLRGGAQFLPAGNEQAFFDSGAALLPLDCPLPVIAVLDGDACGPAWLFAALCDFMLCAEEGSYRYAGKISAAEQALLGARFCIGDAGAVLLSDTARNGRELHAAGLGLTVLPRSDLNTAALALARQLAAAPAPALVLLKQHMAQELRALSQAMLDVWRSEGQHARTITHLPAGLPGGHPAPGWPLPLQHSYDNPGATPRRDVRQIDIGCSVARLDIDASGVALLILCDQRGSNAFSDELVGGVARAFDAVAGLAQARVLVLAAEGSYFSTGGTRASLLAIQAGRARFTDIDIYSRPAMLGIPVIAAMQGHGVGAGWALGMFCDIVIHSTQHSYCSPYMRYGFTPGAGATLAFAEKFGLDLAREILFGAGQYSGAELRARGVPGVFAAGGTVTACALALAAQLAVHDRAALAALKHQNGARIAQRRELAFAQEQAMHAQCFVGNAEVLARIGQHFDEGMAADPEAASAALPVARHRGDQELSDTLLPDLRTMLAEELFMQPADIDAQQKFIDIGLDSITGVNWVRKINARYSLALNATAIYRHPTLHDFAQYVRDQGLTTAAPPPASAPAPINAVPAQKICTITAPVAVSKAAPQVEKRAEETVQQPASMITPKIAVIGMAGQFPKARDLAQFWRNLAEGRDCISEIPSERWSIERYVDSDPQQPGKSYSKWLGCLDDVALFDPLFFGISPREAEWMDPQQRVFLQNAWHCVEDAGYSPAALSGSRCGVFVGCTAGDYSQQIERLDLNAQNFMGRATSILAAKIAYLLNLQGPCLSIDTACSSSLVAMAAACDSLVSGASDMALAGGVCVLAGPDMHIMTSKAGMLSADGRCRTFDEGANGFVPGEGVAVLMLKRLEDAERDGDAIHGVISGWGVNQDGKTNGMTAPNPQAQARLAQQVYRQFAIAPDTIDLVEAHGTGTRLGDPIEVDGLKEAFAAFGTRSGYCALGSVKSNIGHTLAAAGIAGAVKLLLALRHQLMPATLHVEQVNAHIALAGSPFFINSRARPWLPQAGKTRRAAVSSFGFSGTNAHMVIEEYIPSARGGALVPVLAASGPHAVVLSARQPERLPLMARRLLDFLERREQQDIVLADLAYTLQVGREAMAARLALEVHTLDELRSALREVARGGTSTVQLSASVAAWVAGAPLDWITQYWQGAARPRRLSLPGYPFELQRYWLPVVSNVPELTMEPAATLHPLLHQQSSTLFSGLRYSSRFSGAEFFFAQHLIMGRPVLPGVGHLEMVRAAVHAACASQLDTRRMQIKNVVWIRPVACEAKTTTVIHIALTRHEDGEIGFTIFSDATDASQPTIVHSQGVVVVGAADAAPAIDLAAVQARCRNVQPASQHFDTMRVRGADLGPAFRGISDYHLGASEQGVPQVLAHIAIPGDLPIPADRFVLHPTALDAAVHTAPPLMAGWEDAARSALALPFALDELQVLENCQQEMWALAQPAAGATPGALKYDIDLCDSSGVICVRFKGFSFRVVDKMAPPAQHLLPVLRPVSELLMLAPVWAALVNAGPHIAQAGPHVIVLCGFADARPAWQGMFGNAQVHALDIQRDSAEGAADIAAQALELVQALVMARRVDPAPVRIMVQFVVATPDEPMLAALAALARVLRREHPMVEAQVVLTDPENTAMAQQVQACAQHRSATLLHHSPRNGACEALQWRDLDLDRDLDMDMELDLLKPEQTHVPWREGGVYLITGGAGALGRVFAREILARVQRVSLILCGRSPQDDGLLAQLGDRVEYRQADLAQAQQATALASAIRQHHGRLDGVLHCAGVVRDSFIVHKSGEELRAVFAAKVASLLNLDTALTGVGMQPDFMVLFSSIAAALGNAGQADYALANGYLDAYAAQRNGRARTLSINWPLWQDGGMSPDAASTRWMADNTGMAPLQTASGIEAFYRALASGLPQVMALAGDASAIREFISGTDSDVIQTPAIPFSPSPLSAPSSAPSPIPEYTSMEPSPVIADPSRRIEEVSALLRPMVGAILKIAPHQLDADKDLISYGFDSISLTELTNELNARFKIASRRALNPTVFFEQPTLRRFAAYLAAEYPEMGSTPAPAPASASATPKAIPVPALVATPAPAAIPVQPRSPHREPLAVVGISGRFPAARDVREYWRNLAEGRDCIAEVPADRWNWRDVHGDPAQEGNRTDVRFGGFIEGVSEFDALFFGISPREALYMDPMQRLLMQHTWHAIEDAGYSARALSGTRTAIFVGTSVSEYGMLLQQAGVPCDAFLPTGRSPSLGANRMSYLLNITGPSETVDTACSSSLVAIHRAVQAIDSGQADMALVGGVNVLIAPDGHISFRKAGMLSEDGRCKTFSSAADGYARGEGAGMMFLKKLSDAERDGDHIYGLVRGSGENHGGRASSLTAPNPRAQADLIKTVCSEAGVDPRSIGFIEAHGTGTPLGDPVEVNALKMAFRELYQASGDSTVTAAHCGIGSAKSNIGHLELAAGVAGAIKVLLQLKHRTLAKSLHSEPLNPYIDLQGTPFYVVQHTAPWPAPLDTDGNAGPRRAGVSSFGFGGANAHVLFEEYIAPAAQAGSGAPQHDDGRARMIVLSARSEERLRAAAQQMLDAVAEDDAISLDGVAGTLQAGREHFDERLGFLASSLLQLRSQLSSFIGGSSDATLYRGKVVRGDQVLSLFDGDELRDTVSRWAARSQYEKLLALWVKGGDIDWTMLQAASGIALRRVSLPGYPFARERHWPSTLAVSVPSAAVASAASARSIAYLKKVWMPAPAQPCDDIGQSQALILASDATMSLARLLAPQVNGMIVNLDDASTSHGAREISFSGAIDITGCALEAPGPLALLPWLQQLAVQRMLASPGLLLGVTRGLESFDNDSMHLAGAASAGLYRMLHSEYARLRSRHLDLDARDDEATRARQIVNEWLSAGDDAQVSYRKGVRHTARLEEIAAPPSTMSLAFDPASVLWVSGGTRGIGLLCARHFVAHHQVRKLVLTGRQALPPEQDWDRCLASNTPQDAAMAPKIAAVRALREQGVQVEVLALADTAPQVVAEALQRVVHSMGPIGGVLHCAGINDMDTPAFVRKSSEGFGAVLAPKVAGLDALLTAVRGQPLRFMALFSSVAATVPALAAGQSDYACANAYMDYVAEAHAADGAALPIISIQWPSWKDTGMGEAGTRAYRDSGMLSHTDAEGLHMLDTVLASRCGPVVLPAVVDRARWQPQRLMQRSLSSTDAGPSARPVPAVGAVVAGVDGLAATTLGWLAQLFSKELMVAPATLDPHTPFQDYGVDSIMLTQILRRVDTALAAHGKQQALDPSIFYEHPTLSAFAAYLGQACPAALEGLLGSSALPPSQPEHQPPPLQKLRQPQSRAEAALPNTVHGTDIAVIGMACSLPGAADLDAYWRLLAEGRSAIAPVPAMRWQHDGDHYAGLLDNVDSFDARYFLLDERDAGAMDPQALLLLEQSLAALHHAGYSASDIKGSATGVYVGARSGHRPAAEALRQARNPIVAVGQNYLSANISQFFDLQGPSLVLDTACSSALVAMHMALRALQGGEISTALVGGVSLLASGDAHDLFGSRKLLSAGGEFHLFDQRAGGVVLGEGAGMVMLKPLQQALDDGDRVHAVIKGLAINNDGRTAGPATPNLVAQKAVMRAALEASGVQPEQVGYIHANGSGSEVTDLLELKATEAVYRAQADVPCELGSVEPNIGHPLCAKGIAGFIAVVLMLAQRQRVPFLSGQQAMAHYDMARSPFRFGRALERWPDHAPYAALSCFADGGTNAHVILAPWDGAASDRSQHGQQPQRQPLPMPALKRRRIGAGEAAPAWPQCPVTGHLLLTDQHPIVRGHQAYGQQLLPGLAYIDIVFQHFERLGYSLQQLELRNLSIYQPLIVSAGHDVLLEVRCLEQAGGHWQVELEGSDPAADASQPRQRYAMAEMHRVAPAVFDARLDLAQVRREAASTLDLAQLYAQCSRRGLQHDGAIRAMGQVHETARATYIEIEVGPDALADAGAYRFHPALIDGCSVGAQRLFAAFFEGEARLILPLFYASFRASAPFTTRCTARIAADTLRRKNELLYMDIEFFDAAGDKVAHLHNYACKLVRDEGAINPQRKPIMAVSHGADKAQIPVAVNNAATPSTAGAIEQYLAGLMASRIGIPFGQIDTTLGYYELGLDSARLLDLVRELEVRVGAALAPTLLFEYTTIAELAQYLAQQYPAAWKEEAGAAAQVTPSAAFAPAASVALAAHVTPTAASPVATTPQDIAIIGMAGRYPGADDIEQFWEQLRAGADCVTEVPSERWEATRLAGVTSPSGKPMSRWGGFINDADRFDAQFFRISPWEAKLLDPQQRQFLEVCWAAMEDAGYTPQNLVTPRGRHQRRHVGVYAGVMHNDYALLTADAIARSEAMPVSLNYAQIANRVSYFCNFHGPSMAIDTVCSSSLIAVHMAMESLRSGECEVALAGGVNLSLHPLKYMTYGMMDMHASDGRCRAFGKGGDGYVSAEGVGAVLLKPLSHAVRDNDHIYAVIKGSTTNHVGAVSGLTVPSPVAQADMIEQCLEKTGIDPRTISYVEAHGTGTSLGDPIEIQGLAKAFGYYTSDKQYCAIGSVKSNIGHAESAAGISGLTKLALQLQHRTLVQSLHSAQLNPFLDFANTPFYVQQTCEPWRQPTMMQQGAEVTLPRRAALSSFGASGSNAHLILEEYVAPERTAPAPVPLLVPLSAKSVERLQAVAKRLLAYLERHGASVTLADLAYTLQTGRVAMAERVVLIASDIAALRTQLAALAEHGQATLRGTVAKARPATASEAATRLIADADLTALAQAWIQGETIDWAALHARLLPHHAAQRISLPHYPFARDRHWVEAPQPQNAAAPAAAPEPAAANVVYFTPRWQEQPLSSSAAPGGTATTIFAIGAPAGLVAPAGAELKMLAASGDHAADIERHAGALLAWCQQAQRLRSTEAELLIVHAPYHATGHPYRSLMGALRTIAIELPHIRTRLVLDSAIDQGNLPVMRARLRDETGAVDGYTEVAYPPGQPRQVLVQQPQGSAAPADQPTLAAVIRQHGVYLVTGGLGGLGRLFASHIGQGAGARIVLTGRSSLDSVRMAELERLRAQGVQAEYMVCDMAQAEQVQALVDQVVARHGALHGVIHGAGVLADNFIARTSADDLRKVLAAKLAIAHLDRATSAMALDFFVAFSSSAALGNAGQFAYATANAFLDSFMGERTALAARSQRHGRSLSINWPLWQDGGMSMQPAYAQFMREQFGIEPLQQAPGIAAFAAALLSEAPQFGVFQGDTSRIHALLTARPAIAVTSTAAAPVSAAPVVAAPMTTSLDEDMVRAAVAQVLGMAPAALDDDVEFADYGMDSIGATRIAALLNGRLGLALSGAVFMELNSTARLIAHLRQVTLAPAALPAPPSAQLPTTEAPPATMAPVAPPGPQAAIIGIDARLPGAADVAAYWKNLQTKTISIDDEPGRQWQARGLGGALQDDENAYSSMRHAGLIEGVELFDAAFWGLDEQAARAMDPQQRLLLRSIWHCVEDAGIAMQELTRGRVGLFLALDALDYQSLARDKDVAPAQALSTGMIANQISYLCNFTGPSEAVDNACASTYVALKRAVQALAAGECDSAIVGGAKILLDPAGFRSRDEGEILSRSGRMYPFDARADGYVRGEGVGCVLLKPATQAIADGDTIHALVAGVGVTHNGRGALSAVAPSVDGQYRAIRAAYRMAGFAPDSVGYIEAHGTSNSFSDAAELAAFKQFFREQMTEDGYRQHRCAISSVKANIGHLEGASGIASLIKAICALREGRIAPIANWSQLHPSILLEHSPFYLPDSVTPWPRQAGVRRAGLHSIGIGGVNAHVLLEEYHPPAAPVAPLLADGPQLVLLSARSPAALRQLCGRWQQHTASVIRAAPDHAAAQAALAGLARSSQVARDALPYRAAYLVPDMAALETALALGVDQIAGIPFHSSAAYAAANLAGLEQGGAARERTPPLQAQPGMAGLRAAADAWLAGKPVDWRSTAAGAVARVALPSYPFDEKRYWLVDKVDKAEVLNPADPADPFAALFHATFTSTSTDESTIPV